MLLYCEVLCDLNASMSTDFKSAHDGLVAACGPRLVPASQETASDINKDEGECERSHCCSVVSQRALFFGRQSH
jgi:hypothetical protein